ncbi:hypothetical protein [Novosphingobium sp. Leaf2]|uniref:hypothetical protein n=1 Tax=Novosphingobium sp. Leaf2 TaxID=1735670 RepID=UPI001F24A0B9|nr:hypothetical protein [Novosphingobium sp. Leaf2]
MSVLLIVGIPYYWHLVDPGLGPGAVDPAARPVTITQLRTLAAALPGPRPAQLRVETVGMDMVSANMLMAGAGLRSLPTVMRAYELIVPGAAPILIDAGTSARSAREGGVDIYDPNTQARIAQVRTVAAHIVLLADEPAHNGGLEAGNMRAPRELPPASSDAPWPLAPGVVIIPATGMGPDVNMVYVQFAGGREMLFSGDVAKIFGNWAELRLPARLGMRGRSTAYRRANLAWLKTIAALHRAAPNMAIVAGHDPAPTAFSAGRFSH